MRNQQTRHGESTAGASLSMTVGEAQQSNGRPAANGVSLVGQNIAEPIQLASQTTHECQAEFTLISSAGCGSWKQRNTTSKSSSAPLRLLCLASLCMTLFVAGGATCARRRPIAEFQPPVVFDQQPTIEQLQQHVNRSLAIERLESTTLSISSPDIMTDLSGMMKWERPHKFNLEAYPGVRMMGTVLVAGSNEDLFWMQTQYPPPPVLYYARHDEFENQAGPRRILPVSPLWLREALGVAEMDPAFVHQGPSVRTDGDLEVTSFIPSPRGDYRRVLVFDATTGVIRKTLLYNHVGKLVASAQQSEHQYYASVDWSLPHEVHIQMQPDAGPPITFTVEVGFYMLNQPGGNDSESFQPPDTTGIVTQDLVKANAAMQSPPLGRAPAGDSTAGMSMPTYTPVSAGERESLLDVQTLR